MMRETERKATIIERWRVKKDYNAKVINLVGNKMQEHGIPDTVIIHNYLHIWIEFKNPDTEIKLNQIIKHRQFYEQGVKVWLVRFVSEHQWDIENADIPCSIKFKRLAEGCRLLFDTLVSLERARMKGVEPNFPLELTSTISSTG